MNNNRRRSFRPRPQKNNFRRRNGSHISNSSNFNNGNMNFNRNGSMTNPHNVEKTMQKFQQLAKDAQSNGDPVLAQNYLQHGGWGIRPSQSSNKEDDKRFQVGGWGELSIETPVFVKFSLKAGPHSC